MLSGLAKLMLIAVFIPMLLLSPVKKARALELRFTPGHVHGLWVNINQVLLVYSHMVSADEQWRQSLSQMTIQSVSGKLPRDVLEQANNFGHLLETITPKSEQMKALLWDEILFQFKDKVNEIGPSQVYLFSNHMLFEMVALVVKSSRGEIAVGHHFIEPILLNKVPSDVFAQVALAYRRLEAITSHLKQSRDERQP